MRDGNGNKECEGKDEGSKMDGNSNEESKGDGGKRDGNGNLGGGQQKGQWQQRGQGRPTATPWTMATAKRVASV